MLFHFLKTRSAAPASPAIRAPTPQPSYTMSLRSKRTGRPTMYTSSRGFSSMSTGSYSDRRLSGGVYPGASITPVSVNASLLTPLNVDIDPTIQGIRTHEKDQIKTLNNRFASFIDKVRFLEQQNKMLETKWKLLQQQTTAPSSTEPMLKAYIASLQRQLELINNDKARLDHQNTAMHSDVNDYKTKYEDEINKRNGTENDFVLLKKEVDAGYLSKVDLEEKVTSLMDELNFIKMLYEMELCELKESLKDTSAVVEMDNSRTLNMDQIVSEVKAQYEGIASRSREEAESCHKTKFDQMSVQADQYSNELRNTKGEIAELNRLISRLQNEIQNVQGQRNALDALVNETEERGEQAVKDADARIKDLEVALQNAKQDMTRQVREYQELMNIKLALDIEIATYRKLLEGEEDRIGQQSIISIESIPCKSSSVDSNHQCKPNPVLIKTVETWDRSYH